jgi:hypothetical protein
MAMIGSQMWLQSHIAKWSWVPVFRTIPGAVFPQEAIYRTSWRTLKLGRWILAWEIRIFEPDCLPDGAKTVVNGHPCVVRHWPWKWGREWWRSPRPSAL